MLDYTGAPEIDVISHSMGVTLARRVLKGGVVINSAEQYYIGEPLTNKVRTFIGIAGVNRGANACIEPWSYNLRGCNDIDGFWPGREVDGQQIEMSQFLTELNTDPIREAKHTVAMLSYADNPYVYGRFRAEWDFTMD